jgi:hypothetical protein
MTPQELTRTPSLWLAAPVASYPSKFHVLFIYYCLCTTNILLQTLRLSY